MDMKKFAVIVAGGMGMRMGSAVPKQFLLLHDHPVLWYTLETFLSAYEDLQIVLVVPVAHQETAKGLVAGLAGAIDTEGAGGSERIMLVSGGDTRFHSVRNGLEWIRRELGEEAGEEAAEAHGEVGREAIIFVHDGVRCLVSADLIRRCYEQAAELGSAVPVVECRDSVRLVEDEGRSKPIDRSRIKLVQTPQTFRGDILLGAYMTDQQADFTDEATVVEIAGHEVRLIEGEETNMKITTPTDMGIAEQLLRSREQHLQEILKNGKFD
jgi:2-C-methyl-D-erythritol 4-phosphate cytidylyltransferase